MISWFRNLLSKCILHRYTTQARGAAGCCRRRAPSLAEASASTSAPVPAPDPGARWQGLNNRPLYKPQLSCLFYLVLPRKQANKCLRLASSKALRWTIVSPWLSGGSGKSAPPCVPVDMEPLTRGCGPGCTEDGIHYNNATYDAAAQIVFNGLRIAWQHHGGRR